MPDFHYSFEENGIFWSFENSRHCSVYDQYCKAKREMAVVHWWLVRGTLLMEWGLLHDFFGNFSMRGERYCFGWRGAREVRICTRGENVYAR